MKGVAIIGCGLIGQKRAHLLHDCKLVVAVDQVREKAEALANKYPGCLAYTDWRQALTHPEVDLVIISTLHATLAEIALAAVNAGKHILVEKPAARTASELDSVITATKATNVIARVGFNHRYHRAFRQARQLIDQGELGELMFIRGRYGHGGRIGYEKEWRAQPQLSGGGELIDQGVHLIDLARWFLGDFNEINSFAHTYYWNMPVDDNGFVLLKTKEKKVAHLHASCTEWKNTFSFEIFGQKGKLEINGLGGSYGVERLTHYKMLPAMGPPETIIFEYPMNDDSWEVEFNAFLNDIHQHKNGADQANRLSGASLQDAQAALRIVEEVYRISKP